MTAQTRAANKLKFEQGDKPQGSDYVDLIDSFISIADTTVQSISSPLNVTGALGVSTTVSANAIEASAATFTKITATDAIFTGVVSASTGYYNTLTVAGQPISPSTLSAKVEAYIEATAIATCSNVGLFVAIEASVSSQGFSPIDFSASTTEMKVTYTGTSEKIFEVHGFISAKMVAGSNQDVVFTLLKNGTSLTRSSITRRISNTSDFGAIAIGAIVDMSATDTVSVGIKNTSATNNVDVANCNMFLTEA